MEFYTEFSKEAFELLKLIGCESDKPFDYHEFMGGKWFMIKNYKIISADSRPTNFMWFNGKYITLEELKELPKFSNKF